MPWLRLSETFVLLRRFLAVDERGEGGGPATGVGGEALLVEVHGVAEPALGVVGIGLGPGEGVWDSSDDFVLAGDDRGLARRGRHGAGVEGGPRDAPREVQVSVGPGLLDEAAKELGVAVGGGASDGVRLALVPEDGPRLGPFLRRDEGGLEPGIAFAARGPVGDRGGPDADGDEADGHVVALGEEVAE